MTYAEALTYIHKTDWKGSRLGLSRIRELLSRLGDPQKSLNFVHIAGTNGKGSVSSMLTSVLSAAGYRTGLFTSPFLVEFRERIRIGDALICEEELCEALEAVRPHADAMVDSPTEFELMTALAFWYFKEQRCDLVVCEVGLGGELDSTNVIEEPLLSLITSIGLDHVRELGGTLEEIAAAKAGILKRGAPALFGEAENSAALSVISKRAEALGVPLCVPDKKDLRLHSCDLSGVCFSYGRFEKVSLRLCGAYQPQNAALVLEAVELLISRGLSIKDEAVFRGLSQARWPGRFEVFSADPIVIFDGAHNPHAASALLSSLDQCVESRRFLAVSAVMADKEYRTLFSTLAPRLEEIFCVAPAGHARALAAEKLAAFCGELSLKAQAFSSVSEGVSAALDAARRKKLPVIVFGSLYLYAEASAAIRVCLSGE